MVKSNYFKRNGSNFISKILLHKASDSQNPPELMYYHKYDSGSISASTFKSLYSQHQHKTFLCSWS